MTKKKERVLVGKSVEGVLIYEGDTVFIWEEEGTFTSGKVTGGGPGPIFLIEVKKVGKVWSTYAANTKIGLLDYTILSHKEAVLHHTERVKDLEISKTLLEKTPDWPEKRTKCRTAKIH